MSQSSHKEIEFLRAEARNHEAEAKRFSEMAGYVNGDQHKRKLEHLADEARQKAAEIRKRVRQIQNSE